MSAVDALNGLVHDGTLATTLRMTDEVNRSRETRNYGAERAVIRDARPRDNVPEALRDWEVMSVYV